MNTRILIVEDHITEANNLAIILRRADYTVCTISRSVSKGLKVFESEKPDLVLLNIHLNGELTGIDFAQMLRSKNVAVVFLSAGSNPRFLDAANATRPYGFLLKPFREKDVLVTVDVAWHLHCKNRTVLRNGRQSMDELSVSGSREIIGSSERMREVMSDVKIVGESDIAVLIIGESGTGKEMIAQSIHYSSSRKLKPFVAVNCAALPATLIESELFGHERGSFTGATDKRIGKFEMGNGGTVFLDEVGELPLELQVKLLRVLQEKEVEPIGGRKKKIDVRIIAATNRNLEEEVAKHRFRLDLYYRLNVFPITLPPLRERKEDIAALARHFVNVYACKENKTITGLADHVLQAMFNYNWPGNIRELENLIARSVLLNTGPVISSVKLPGTNGTGTALPPKHIKTMTENERDHILSALEWCSWKIYGQGGAAELLELNPSTLNSRMKKLGIEKSYTRKV